MSVQELIILVAVLVIVLPIGFILLLRKWQLARVTELKKALRGESILFLDQNANFFGRDSLGVLQIRGSGILAITQNNVCFYMLLPKREFKLAIAQIEAVENPTSHLSKTIFRPLLKLTTNDGQQRDSYAWALRDLQKATAQIRSLLKRQSE